MALVYLLKLISVSWPYILGFIALCMIPKAARPWVWLAILLAILTGDHHDHHDSL
jgi:hypothetical protein